MRILIISLPRSGSTELTKKYSKKYNLKIITEPYNSENKKMYNNWENENNIVVKTIINQSPDYVDDYIKYWTEISKQYDEVILLSRKNLKECAESLSYLLYNKKNNFNATQEYNWKLTPNYNDTYNFVIKISKDLILLSELINKKIVYYEDLYDLSSKNRLRKINVSVDKLI